MAATAEATAASSRNGVDTNDDSVAVVVVAVGSALGVEGTDDGGGIIISTVPSPAIGVGGDISADDRRLLPLPLRMRSYLCFSD